MQEKLHRINIGAGKDIKEGWDNLDYHNRLGANLVWDMNDLPTPFKDGAYDYVLCSHLIEDWAEPMPLIRELARITKVGGQLEIRVPHEKSKNAWGSIAHKKAYNGETLYYIAGVSKDYDENYYPPLKVVSLEYYANPNWKNPLLAIYKSLCVGIRNIFGVYGERLPIIRSISSPDMSIKIIYEKTNGK